LSRLEKSTGVTRILNIPKEKSFSFIMVNSQLTNSPTSPKTFPNNFKLITNSTNILHVHEVVVKRHAALEMLRFGEKTVWFVVVEKPSCTSRKNEVAPKTSKFTCKCHACSKWISKTHVEVLVHKHHHQILQHHAKSRKHQKIYRSQMLFHHSTANSEFCSKMTWLSPNSNCHTS
jgi:hypothetical protein